LATTNNIETIRGNILRVVYRQPEGLWKIGVVRELDYTTCKSKHKEITVTGYMPEADIDECIEFTGNWEDHKIYGRQFKATSSIRLIPTSTAGLEKFLYKEIKGVGPVIARRMAVHFGSELKFILDNNPNRLTEVVGITQAKAKKIADNWAMTVPQQPLKIFLAHHGISPDWSRKITNEFGANAQVTLIENPYRLTQVEGIGFKTADKMALLISSSWATSPERVRAAFTFVLQEATVNGHCFLDRGKLIEEVIVFTGASSEITNVELDNVISSGTLIQETIKDRAGNELKILYLPMIHKAEVDLTKRLVEMATHRFTPNPNLEDRLQAVQKEHNMVLSSEQKEAVLKAFSYHGSIITGGPGTGKTTTTLTIVRVAERLGLNVVLACPTGRAAKRLAEVSEREASTIHRLLGFNKITGQFTHNAWDPIDADLLILDEFSMVDLDLANKLFDAVPPHCSVIIIGDVDQLPAVGPGMVLRDIIDCGKLPMTVLDTVFRQAEGSLIIKNAHHIRRGEAPVFFPKDVVSNMYLMSVPRTYSEDAGKKMEDVHWLKETLISLVTKYIPQKLFLNSIRDVQVLVPMKKNSAGVIELNEVLRTALNPEGCLVGKAGFRIGDRVMQMKNNYKLEVFNGDIGFVMGYDHTEDTMQVEIDNVTVNYDDEDEKELQLAYATTIHKSQGSEYPVTIVVMLWQHRPMLERNLLYTATTRAKRMALFLGTQEAINFAVNNGEVRKRNTFLMQRLRKALTP